MKKMSEVFKLPMNPSLHIEVARSACAHCKAEAAQYAAHAINHADALAGALQALFDDYKALADSGDAGNWKLEETAVGAEAMVALAAYRGEK